MGAGSPETGTAEARPPRRTLAILAMLLFASGAIRLGGDAGKAWAEVVSLSDAETGISAPANAPEGKPTALLSALREREAKLLEREAKLGEREKVSLMHVRLPKNASRSLPRRKPSCRKR